MAEETAHLLAVPDLTEQVVRRSHRRRRTRAKALAVATALAILCTGIGGYVMTRDRDQVAATTTLARLDDVMVRYLPPDLGRPTQGSMGDAGTLTWGSADDLVRVTRYGASPTPDPATLMPDGAPFTIRGRPGRISPNGTDLLWREWPGLLLRVTVGANHTGDLGRIAEGLRMWDPTDGTLAGIRVSYLPPTVHLAAPATGATRKWTGADGKQITLTAVQASSLEEVMTWGRGHLNLERGQATKVNGKPGYESRTGDARLWLQGPGQGFILTVSDSLLPETNRILAGITPLPPTPGLPTTFEGITVTHLPPGLQPAGTGALDGIGMNWGGGGEVRIEVVRGDHAKTLDTLKNVSWPTNERFADLRRTTVNRTPGLTGRIQGGDTPRGHMTLWVARPGYGIRVHVSDALAGELPAIAAGVTVNPPPPPRSDEVDGIRLGHLPEGLTRENTTRAGETSTTGTWRDAEGRELRVEVHRGGPSTRYWIRESLGVPTAVTTLGEGDRVRVAGPGWTRELWLVDGGLAIVVTTNTDLDRVMKGLRIKERRPEPKRVNRDQGVPVNGSLCDARSTTPPPPGKALPARRSVRGLWFTDRPKTLTRGAGFTTFDGLVPSGEMRIYGYTWTRPGSPTRLSAGVVCGVQTSGQLAALVPGAQPAVLRGKPALTWARQGALYAMWLERPGAAVFSGGTADLTEGLEAVTGGLEVTPWPQ